MLTVEASPLVGHAASFSKSLKYGTMIFKYLPRFEIEIHLFEGQRSHNCGWNLCYSSFYSIFKTGFLKVLNNCPFFLRIKTWWNPGLEFPDFDLKISVFNLSRVSLIFQFWIFDAKNSEYSIWNASLSKNYTMNGPFSDRHISRLRQEIALVINLFIVPYILNWYAIYHTIPSILRFKTMSLGNKYIWNRCYYSLIWYSYCNCIIDLFLRKLDIRAWWRHHAIAFATKHSGNSGIVKCECRSPRL